MDKEYKILLKKEKSVLSTNINEEININIDNTTKPLPLGDVEHTVNTFEQYEKERAESTKYRFYGVVNPMVCNMLYNDNVFILSGNTGIVGKKISSDSIFEKDGWYGSFYELNDDDKFNDNKSSLCQFTPFDPGYERLNILDTDGQQNYMLKITYPYAKKDDITLVENNSGITISNGIPVIEKLIINIHDRSYTGFKTPINHGLSEGDEIKMYNFTDVTGDLVLSAKTISIFKLGDQTNDEKERVFVIDISPTDIDINLGVSTIKRSVNDVESEYYVRSFSALTTDEVDYDIYPAAFGVNYFNDDVAAFYFKNDIDIKDIRDNLGRPLSELFLTIIKQDEDLDPTNINHLYWLNQQSGLTPTINKRFWTEIKGGYDTEKHELVNYNIRAVGSNPDISPTYTQEYFDPIDESDTLFDGDIVEYNSNDLIERKLEDIYHRINTIYRENYSSINTEALTGFTSYDLKEGYIYTPHKKIQIRSFSEFIEEGDSIDTIGIPDYATLKYSADTQPLSTGPIETIPLSTISRKYKWRDLLDIGFIDSGGNGVNYPFESGAHYIHMTTRFYLQRQDPPCRILVTNKIIDFPKDEAELIYFLGLPSFVDYNFINYEELLQQTLTPDEINNLTATSQEQLETDIRFVNYYGNYNLGERYTPGGCIDLYTCNVIIYTR